MRCEDLQNLISLTGDDVLEPAEQEMLNEHFSTCPLCRQERDDFRNLTRDLRMMRRPAMPNAAVHSLRNTIFQKLGVATPGFWLFDDHRPWRKAWLVPSGVGTFASILAAITFLWLLSISPGSNARKPDLIASTHAPLVSARTHDKEVLDLTQQDYSETRQDVSIESPSLNPKGALVALTNSLVRGEMKDDEVVVVADVFGNGLARIAEVVEPSRDRRAVNELEKALRSDPSFAPFVPATLDQRPDSVRVILKIRNVNVSTRLHARHR